MFETYSHFLAYGSTDQETLRELTDEYAGLLVPGTVAAYQAEGTRGFVLTWSVAADHPYAIDPRTPLFQYQIVNPKQSHVALARVLGIEEILDRHGKVAPDDWTDELCHRVARSWNDFNSNYIDIAPKQFQKYARRLGRDLSIAGARRPTWVLAPYLMHTYDFDASAINDRLWAAAVRAAGEEHGRLRRVIAATDAGDLTRLALTSGQKEVAVWLDNLDEFDVSNSMRLTQYASAIAEMTAAGIRPFALYGGFFAVALATVGLRGASHGVGFSEHRNHVELKSSGGAPARFYVQRLHRYLPIDLASELWRQDPGLVASYYGTYRDRDPGEYSYHELMKHSVLARSNEIERIGGKSAHDVASHLNEVADRFREDYGRITLSRAIAQRIDGCFRHLPVWAQALEGV